MACAVGCGGVQSSYTRRRRDCARRLGDACTRQRPRGRRRESVQRWGIGV